MRCLFFPLYFSLRKRWLSWRGGSSNVGLISDGKSGEDKEQPHIGIDAYLTHIDLDVHGLLIHRKSELQEFLTRTYATSSVEDLHVALQISHILHGVFGSIAKTVEDSSFFEFAGLCIVLNGCSVELPHGHFGHYSIIINGEMQCQMVLLEEDYRYILLCDKQGNVVQGESEVERIFLWFLLGVGRRCIGWRIEQHCIQSIIVGDGPIETFHEKGVIVVVEIHKERSHHAFHTYAIVEILGQFFLVVLRIGDQVSGEEDVHIVGQFISMLFPFGVEVVHCNAERIQIDIVTLYQDDWFVASHVITIDCLVRDCYGCNVQLHVFLLISLYLSGCFDEDTNIG